MILGWGDLCSQTVLELRAIVRDYDAFRTCAHSSKGKVAIAHLMSSICCMWIERMAGWHLWARGGVHLLTLTLHVTPVRTYTYRTADRLFPYVTRFHFHWHAIQHARHTQRKRAAARLSDADCRKSRRIRLDGGWTEIIEQQAMALH